MRKRSKNSPSRIGQHYFFDPRAEATTLATHGEKYACQHTIAGEASSSQIIYSA